MTTPSKNKVVLFIRHAEVSKDDDQSLSELGIEQSKSTANYIVQKVINDNSFDLIKVFASPESIAMESVIPLVEQLKDNDVKFHFRVLQNLYEYKRPNNEDYHAEINGKRYPIKVDKTWDHFIKRVDAIRNLLERELNTEGSQLIIVYGHPVFFSSHFTNLVNQCKSYPKHYNQITIHLPNCSMSATGLGTVRNNVKKWDIFSLANTNHLEGIKSGIHVNF